MRIISFAVNNYKSFRQHEVILLAAGFNVVVGPNNVGKTALAEALSLRFDHRPHRSLVTAPNPGSVLPPASSVEVTFELDPGETREILAMLSSGFYVPVTDHQDPDLEFETQKLQSFSTGSVRLDCTFSGSQCQRAQLHNHVPLDPGGTFSAFHFRADSATQKLVPTTPGVTTVQYTEQVGIHLANALRDRVYWFRAERLNIGEHQVGPEKVLLPDASNLAQVLDVLKANPARFERLNRLMSTVFPDVTSVVTIPVPNNRVRIQLWSVDPQQEREDLAVPLADSGTGIGQVLAILYVILTSDYSRPIIIDEPQSFLHPGAIRKLVSILNSNPKHQYIVTTHSPTVVTAAQLEALFRLRKVSGESEVETLDVGQAESLRVLLTEVGARLGDVFGADYVLWVEGRTEELCFPAIPARSRPTPTVWHNDSRSGAHRRL